MSRDDGFQIADIDVGILRDVKIRRLRQHVPAADVSATTLLYLAVLLSSWEEGYRLTVDEADSPIPATPERVAALRATELLDDDGKVPVHAWESWFKPAWERRDKKRAAAHATNRKRWHPDSPTESLSDVGSDIASDIATESPSVPSVPSVRPTGPSVTRAPRANDGSRDPTTTTNAVVDDRRSFTEKVFGAQPALAGASSPAGTKDVP